MIHIRIADGSDNYHRRLICGIGPELPESDTCYYDGESLSRLSDCPGCNPGGPRELGTPISQLSGRSGHPGYEKFCQIARSWGHE